MAYTNVTLWSDTTGVTIYIRQIGSVESGPIAGVKSCTVTRIDDYYDTDVYRDTSDLAYPWTVGMYGLNAVSWNRLILTKTTTNETPTTAVTEALPTGSTAGEYASGDDRLTHVPPRDVKKSRSLIQFWNGVNGTGAVLAASWADEYMGMSIAQFETIQ